MAIGFIYEYFQLMIYFWNFFGIVFVLEENGKSNGNYGGVNGKIKPNTIDKSKKKIDCSKNFQKAKN
jgi:hypothetical protein